MDHNITLLFSLQEEELFKWDVTTYPEVDYINVAIEPYQKLFSAVAKWQRSEKKWMDGAFLDLDAEAIEAEVVYFLYMVLKLPGTE